MKTKSLYPILLCLSILLLGCNRDPEAAKRKYVENGNKYFEREKYKEALIMYRKALQQDGKYGEAYFRSALAQLKLQRYVEASRSLQRAVELQPTNLEAHKSLTDLYLASYASDPSSRKFVLPELKTLADKASANFPNSYERERLDGFLALFDNDSKEAEEHFAKANERMPNRSDVVDIYMQVLTANGKADQAEKIGYQMLKANPKSVATYDTLSAMFIRNNRRDDAERIMQQKIENNPKLPDGYLQLATFYYATQRRDQMLSTLNRLTSNNKDFPNGPMLVGDFYVRTRDDNKAIESYQAGVKNGDKDKHTYQKRIVEALVRQNKKDEAVRLIGDVLKEDGQDGEALAIRAGLSLMTGTKEQIQNAVNDLQSAASKLPENPVIRYNLGRALLAKGDVAQAKLKFEEAIKIQPGYVPPRVMLAELYVRSGDFSKATQMVQEALSRDPNNLQARLIRTRAWLGAGDLKQARAELTQIAGQNPNLAEVKLQTAVLDLSEKNLKGAEDSFKKIFDTSQDPRALMGLIDSYIAQGQPAAAIKLLHDELNKHPDRVDYRATLGNVYFGSGDFQSAIGEYKKVLERVPQSTDISQRLAESYTRAGDLNSATSTLKKAQEAAPSNPGPMLQLALLYDTSEQSPQARPLYEQVLRIQPENPIALNNMAYMLADTGGDLNQAQTMAQKAKQQLPKNTDISDTLGLIFIKRNLPDSAINIYRDLITQQPNRATYRYHYALALSQKGDNTTAKKELEAALRGKPTKSEESRIRELMAKIG